MITAASMFLTREEVSELTSRIQYSAQRKVLCMMGIEHRTRPDGSIAVLRSHVEELFGYRNRAQSKSSMEPNWEALNATRT